MSLLCILQNINKLNFADSIIKNKAYSLRVWVFCFDLNQVKGLASPDWNDILFLLQKEKDRMESGTARPDEAVVVLLKLNQKFK